MRGDIVSETYSNNKMVIIANRTASLPRSYEDYRVKRIDKQSGNKDEEEAKEFIPNTVITDKRIEDIYDYIRMYYKDFLIKLDPQEEFQKLYGTILLGDGIHGLIIAAWFDLYLEALIPYYSHGITENKCLDYQDKALYKVIREYLEKIILKEDPRLRNDMGRLSTSPLIKKDGRTKKIIISKEYKKGIGTETVRGGYLIYLSRKARKEYIRGGKTDKYLKNLSDSYLLLAYQYETKHWTEVDSMEGLKER